MPTTLQPLLPAWRSPFDENINKLTGNITLTGTGFSQTIAVAGNAVKGRRQESYH
jgi:hypothetical protein